MATTGHDVTRWTEDEGTDGRTEDDDGTKGHDGRVIPKRFGG